MMLLRLLLVLLVAAPPHVLSQVASGTHTPSVGACPPDFNLIRDAGSSDASCRLSAAENAYIQARRLEVLPGAWASYLQSVKNTQAPLPDYVSAILGSGSAPWSHTPTLGIAVSGGGYRAAIFGAGAMNALDGRNATSQGAGTGGLLQAASYVSGLSGGSWLVGSLAQADFPMLGDLVKGWNAKFDPLQPTKDATKDAGFFQALVAEIRGKHDVGFQISFADIWSRALSRHFVSGTDENNFFDPALPHGAGVTLSSIAEL
jgi:lysophospholipase